MTRLLEIQGLTAGYGEIEIIRNLNLTITAGETAALLGRNGMGKTTLLKAIFGQVDIHQGQQLINERPVTPLSSQAVALRGVTLVPDDRGVFASLSVGKNLELSRLLASRRNVVPYTDEEAFEFFPDLADRTEQLAGQLSGGLQQQLAIARALSMRPKLLLIDELSQGIQPSVIESLAESLIRVTRDEKLALVLVDQSPELAMEICSRTIVLQKGEIAIDKKSEDFQRDKGRLYELLAL